MASLEQTIADCPRGPELEGEEPMIDPVAVAQLSTLPEPARAKTLQWLADGQSWGWKLLRLDIRCVEDRVHVLMRFNVGEVEFAAQIDPPI